MCSRNQWLLEVSEVESQDYSQSQQSSPAVAVSSGTGKKTRFRFTEAERIKALRELFNILCEDVFETEQDLWDNLRRVLCHDSARYVQCIQSKLEKRTRVSFT